MLPALTAPAMRAGSDPVQAAKYECWARSQIRYMIGDSGRSYVVGFGNTPPGSEHHRGASCPAETSLGSNNPVCDYSDYALPTPNPNVLYGALVGGARAPPRCAAAALDGLACLSRPGWMALP